MIKNHLHRIVILGSVWGIFEATLGYLLHMYAVGIGWAIWFPVAFFFINRAYVWTKNSACVMATAILASSLKLINLIYPVRIDMVINPAVSIILEALSVVLVFRFAAGRERDKLNPFDVLLIGFVWRTFYLAYVFLLPDYLLEISPAVSALSFSRFMFFENAANWALICFGLLLTEKIKYLRFEKIYNRLDNIAAHCVVKPVLCSLMFALAVLVKLVTV